MNTILGAGGPVSNALTRELEKNQEPVRLVSRRKIITSGNTTWVQADLTDKRQVLNAVKESSVIYMCAGLKYDRKVWAEEWPRIMENLIEGAKITGGRLIFFDNVYMYGHVHSAMTEETPYNPSSVKGEIRAKIARRLMNEAQAGNIRASIARAADFYGAESLNSFYDSMVLKKYSEKGKAMWLGDPESKHSFTFVPDAGKALAILGKYPASDNQIWHIPTSPALTGYDFIRMAADIFHTNPGYMRINRNMLRAIGFFNKLIGETAELYYQYQYDYIFNSEKFEKAFGLRPTSYAEGIKHLSETMFKQ